MAKLNKTDLVELVKDVVELDEGQKSTKKMAAAYVDAVITAIHTALANGDSVALQGHGEYEVRELKARKGRNPQTGEEIEIPANRTVGFKAKGIKAVVRG